jgi:tetratricopeptide (TPR) repeat protein
MNIWITRRAVFGAMLMLFAVNTIAADLSIMPHKRPAVWLTIGERPAYPTQTPLLSWELYRQAMLIAARDGLGLATRDESLREWKTGMLPSEAITPSLQARQIGFNTVVREQKDLIWQGAVDGDDWPNDCATLAVKAEKLSREDLVAALRAHGWSGTGNKISADAEAPADVEKLLGQMDELSQFSALRLTHAAIATDGESAVRLGALVRGYANLSQLAQLQFSAESDVYAARAILYAQRMVASDPKSAFALWHRAYAFAMVGLQGAALSDLKNAADLKDSEAPKWVALLEPYCRYQPKRLRDAVAADASQTALGSYLGFLMLENSGSQGATMSAAQAAQAANPTCLRLIDAMCDHTGPGPLNQLTEQGPAMFSQMLGNRLTNIQQFPQPVSDQIQKLRRQEGNPGGRETVCQALINAGEVGADKGEPSWAALGRMIQEITYAQSQRRANLIAEQWGVDASDYVQDVRPIVADHPYKGFIEAYGLVHGNDMQALQNAMTDFSGEQMTVNGMRFRSLQWRLGTQNEDRIYNSIFRNLDCTSNSLNIILRAYSGNQPAQWLWLRKLLASVDPNSPVLAVQEITLHWDASKAATLESDFADYPSVAYALGLKYNTLKQWVDAERCLTNYIALSPDYRGYEALAAVYWNQQQEAQWLATLQDFLKQPSYGLEQENVQVQIAQYYMVNGAYDKALPYADAAAQTGAAGGLSCAAAAHAGLGKWDEAEQLILEEMNHYSESPYRWYAWCVRLGHGNREAAAKAVHEYFAAKQDSLSDEDMIQFACLDILEHKDADAIAMFQKRADKFPGPLSQLHIAVIADSLRDAETRDNALQAIPDKPKAAAPLLHVAAALRDAVKNGPDAEPDTKAINTAMKNATPADRITICYVVGRWHQTRGDKEGAIASFQRCFSGFRGHSLDRDLAEEALRQLGVDPLEIERSMAGPGREISLEP